MRTLLVVGVLAGLVIGGGRLWNWRGLATSMDRPALATIAERGQEPVEGVANLLATLVDDDTVRSMALVQLHPQRPAPVVVSLPLDLKVDVPGRGEHRLGDVPALQGPGLHVRVVEAYTGLEVDHWIEVDVAGLPPLVDAVGGVEVCSPAPCRALAGTDVAQLLRAPAADEFAAVEVQHGVLVGLGRAIGPAMPWWNPVATRDVIEALGGAVRVDDTVRPSTLVARLETLAASTDVEPDVRVVPGFWSPQTGFVHALPEQSAMLWQALATGADLPAEVGQDVVVDLEPANVRVMVLNGEGTEGLAGLVADVLRDADFDVAGTDNHETFDVTTTLIQTTSADEPRARLLLDVLPGAELQVLPRLSYTNVHVVVVIGADRAGLPDAEPSDAEPSDAESDQ